MATVDSRAMKNMLEFPIDVNRQSSREENPNRHSSPHKENLFQKESTLPSSHRDQDLRDGSAKHMSHTSARNPAPLAEDEVDYYDRLLDVALPGEETVGREEEIVGPCGWGSCNPSCLRPCASVNVFVVLFLLLAFLSGFQGSYTVAVLTTLEKRYNLPSNVSGMLVTISTVGYISTILFIAQLGRGGHMPKILAASSLAIICSSLFYTLPHFIYGSGNENTNPGAFYYNYPTNKSEPGQLTQYCQLEDITSNFSCDTVEGGETSYIDSVSFNAIAFALLLAAEIITGVAGSPFWSIGISFLDDSLSRRLASKIIGILYTVRFASPVASFMLGAWFLTKHATLEETSLTPEHPDWVGAWYLGYLVSAVACLLICIPMSMLPKHLKKLIDKDKKSEMVLDGTQDLYPNKDRLVKESSHFDNITDMPKTIARLACNPVYLLTVLALMIDVLVVGYIIFMPKYLEVQYQMPAWRANLVGGLFPALSGGIASYISGQMSSRVQEHDSSARFCRLTAVCSTLSILTILAGMGLGCDPIRLAPTDYVHSGQSFGLCSGNCSCQTDIYDPVCGSDGLLYLSPCHAGCPDPVQMTLLDTNITSNTSLVGCSCTPDGLATGGMCETNCFAFLAMFMVVSYTSIFLLNLYNVPVTYICLRSVNKEDKAMAFAVLMFLCSIVALPAPVIIGHLIDSTCLVHKTATCSDGVAKQGVCLLYDRDAFRFHFHSVTVVVKACATIFYIIPWLIARKTESKTQENLRLKYKTGEDVIETEVVALRDKNDTALGKAALNSIEKPQVC